MSNGIIHFRNEPFMARVDSYGKEPVECTPVVYDEDFNCGVGVIYSGTGSVWGLCAPRNLIAAWRATEILRHLDRIESGTLCAAYYAGLRNPHKSDYEQHVIPMIQKIGARTYHHIMSLTIPETVIRAILDNQEEKEGTFAPDTWPIAQEVRAGTITWRQEFADAGIEHPDETDAKKRAKEEAIARYEKQLLSLSAWDKLPRQCLGMWSLESALLEVVEKGIEEMYGTEVAVALAAVVGKISTASFANFLMPSHGPETIADMYHQMERIKRDAATDYANWIISMMKTKPKRWSRYPSLGPKTREDYVLLLMKLMHEHFPPKDPELAKQVTEEFERSGASKKR